MKLLLPAFNRSADVRDAASPGGTDRAASPALGALVVASVLLAAIGAWAISLPAIDLRELNDLGLVSVMPLTSYASLGLASLGLVLALRLQPISQAVCLAAVATIVVVLSGTIPVLAEVMTFPTAWLHVGFIDTIARTGELLPQRDARFDWPGFFVYGAFVTSVTGIHNPVDVGGWAPLILSALYLPPLLVIARSVTTDARRVWLAVAIFYITNWVGQDYLSPQGFNILLYLTIFAVVLSVFPASSRRPWTGWLHRYGLHQRERPETDDERAAVPEGRTRAGLVVVLAVIFAVVASSHQLTPFAAIGGMTALVVFGRTSLRGLPVIMVVIVGTWISYMTVTYLAGHVEGILADLGQAEQIAASTIVARVRGSADHQSIVVFRLVFSLAVWLLAAAGAVLRLRAGQLDLAVLLLAAAPFGLLGLQAYGGEMLLRVYLFSLPFVALLVAAAFYRSPRARPLRHGFILLATVFVLMSGFMVARYGNARVDVMTGAERDAAEALYRLAPPDSLIAVASNSTPLRHTNWEQYRYGIVREALLSGDVDDVVASLAARDVAERHLFLTRSQSAILEIFRGIEQVRWDEILDDLRSAPEFERVYENADAIVFRLRDEAAAGTP